MPLFGGPPDVTKLVAEKDVKGLIKALEYWKDAGRTSSAATEALGRAGDPTAVGPLIAALADGADYPGLDSLGGTRRTAAEALGLIGDARAVGPLVAALKDRVRRVGEAAAAALDQMGVPETQRSAAGPPSTTSSAVAADRTEGG